MASVLVPLLLRLAFWLGAFLILGGTVQKVAQNIETIGSAITSGPVKTVTNAWIEVAVVAAGLGFVIWLVEAKTAKHMGQDVAPPPVATIGVASPPQFGAAGGASYTGGGFSVGQAVDAKGHGGSAPTVHYVPAPPREPRTTERRPSKQERRTAASNARADELNAENRVQLAKNRGAELQQRQTGLSKGFD